MILIRFVGAKLSSKRESQTVGADRAGHRDGHRDGHRAALSV